MKNVFTSIGLFILIISIIVGCSFGSLAMYKFFAPQWEGARTDVYRNTKSYIEGNIRDFRKLKREYDEADDSQKTTLKTIILQRSDEVDIEKMPQDIVRFINSIQKEN